jgi:hypothetical protein
VNIQDRIAKLEKELKQLKIDLAEDQEITEAVWKPRVGEIVLMSHHGDDWETMRFVAMRLGCYVAENGDFYDYCKPLNDPMVIQLIPHVPGDPNPTIDDCFVLIKYRNGVTDILTAEHAYWGTIENSHDGEIVAWAPLDED